MPDNLLYIIDEIKRINYTNEVYAKNNEKTVPDMGGQNNNISIITIDKDKSEIREIKQRIKDILIKQRIKDYVVINDIDNNNQLKIVNKDHAEKLGIYHCRHCGMAFEDQIQLSTHLRLHYFI
ncbi:MAG TPA: C2H2-type zinc finger protein [Nitrososphaeraceae archaeon]